MVNPETRFRNPETFFRNAETDFRNPETSFRNPKTRSFNLNESYSTLIGKMTIGIPNLKNLF
jgi:hypothetical protein